MTPSPPPPPFRVAGVGAGYFSQFHYEGWRRLGGVRLVGVADRDLDAAARRAEGALVFGDLAALLAAGPLDILDVITPPSTHLEMIETALAAGVPTIICQKPFCRDPAEARRAVLRADEAGATLIVHENFRFQPWWRALKAALTAEACGCLRQMTFRLRPGDGQGPDAYLDRQPYFQRMPRFLLRETGVHWIDLFLFLMGRPDAIFADLRRLNPAIAGEDAGYFIFFYADGRRALFDGNRLLDHGAGDRRRTMGEALVEGDAGVLALDGDGVLRRRAFGATAWRETPAPSAGPGFGGGCVEALQAHVVAALRDGAPLENRAADYLDVLEIEAALYASADAGAKVTLPPRR